MKKKRFLSIVLSCLLTAGSLSLTAIPAYAEEFTNFSPESEEMPSMPFSLPEPEANPDIASDSDQFSDLTLEIPEDTDPDTESGLSPVPEVFPELDSDAELPTVASAAPETEQPEDEADLSQSADQLFSDAASEDSADLFAETLGAGTIALSQNGKNIGSFTSLEDAFLKMTDASASYSLVLSAGTFQIPDSGFPAAAEILFAANNPPMSSDNIDSSQETMLVFSQSSLSLRSNISLTSIALMFSASQGTLGLGSHTLTMTGTSTLSASDEENASLSVTGGSGSCLTVKDLAGEDSGMYGVQLTIDTVDIQTDQSLFNIYGQNAGHTINTLKSRTDAALFFCDYGTPGISQSSLTIHSIMQENSLQLHLLGTVNCDFGQCSIPAEKKLYLYSYANQINPDKWGDISFSGSLQDYTKLSLEYLVFCENGFQDIDHAFFEKSIPSIICPAPANLKQRIVCTLIHEDDTETARTYILEDMGNGRYSPNTAYTFFYSNPTFTKIEAPKVGQKIGNTTVPLGGAWAACSQVTKAFWSSPKGLTAFKEGELYHLTIQIENRPNVRGLFTNTQIARLVLNGVTYPGEVSVSDNILTIRFTYNGLEKITSLETPVLVSAKSVNGKTADISWKAVEHADGYRIYRKTANGKWQALKTRNGQELTTYRDTSAVPGVTYTYTVRAYRFQPENKVLWSSYDPKGVSVVTKILAPQLTKISQTAKGIQICWNQSAGAAYYRIYRKTASASKWTYLGTVKSTVTSYYDNTLTAPGTYIYTVKGIYGKVNGYYDAKGLSVTATRPAAPALSPTERTEKGIRISWTPVDNAFYYKVYRKTPSSPIWTCLAVVGESVTEFYDNNIPAWNTYVYTVKGINGKINGYYNAKGTTAYVSRLKAPILSPTEITAKGVDLSWAPVSGAEFYRIYRKTSSSAPWSMIGTTKSSVTTFCDTKVTQDGTYLYTVRAFLGSLGGSFDPKGVSALIPALHKLDPTTGEVKIAWKTYNIPPSNTPTASAMLTWQPQKAATGYRVYRKLNEEDKWTLAATLPATADSYLDEKSFAFSTDLYIYSVRPVIAQYEGPFYPYGIRIQGLGNALP